MAPPVLITGDDLVAVECKCAAFTGVFTLASLFGTWSHAPCHCTTCGREPQKKGQANVTYLLCLLPSNEDWVPQLDQAWRFRSNYAQEAPADYYLTPEGGGVTTVSLLLLWQLLLSVWILYLLSFSSKTSMYISDLFWMGSGSLAYQISFRGVWFPYLRTIANLAIEHDLDQVFSVRDESASFG